MQILTPKFNIWVDGSHHRQNGQSGAGILFTAEEDGAELFRADLPTTHLSPGDSTQAEIIAATIALKLAHKFSELSGRSIYGFYGDNRNVLNMMIEDRPPATVNVNHSLEKFCRDFFEVLRSGGTPPRIEHVSDTNNENMKQVHNLAKDGASVRKSRSFESFNTVLNSLYR